MTYLSRQDLGNFLSAHMPTRTIASPELKDTPFEGLTVQDDWMVWQIMQDQNGIVCIECVPLEWAYHIHYEASNKSRQRPSIWPK